MDYSKSLKVFVRIAFVVGLVVGGVACGDDSEDDGGMAGTAGMGGSGGSTGGSGGSTGGSGGMGGTGGMGMTGGMGGSGGAPPPMAAMCGTTMCPIVVASGTMLSACCPAEPANSCGAVTGLMGTTPICTGTFQEGVEVPAEICPRGVKNALEMEAKGCCRPDGKCGFLSASLMGCIERSVYPTGFLSAMEPTTSMFPLMTVECTPPDSDAGL
jgi:hypothetical protein